MVCFGNDWDTVLAGEFEKEYYLKLREFLKSEYIGKKYPVYPPMNDIFNALKRTAYKDVKVVISRTSARWPWRLRHLRADSSAGKE